MKLSVEDFLNMPRKLSGLFLIVCTLVAMYAHEELNGGQRGPLSFNELMMQPHEPLSSTDAEELKGIERDYNRDIDYLCATSIHTVPKIIHFIWIGPRAFPKNSIDNLKSWKQYHPHWKFYFWTDSKDRPLPMSGMERRLIQE